MRYILVLLVYFSTLSAATKHSITYVWSWEQTAGPATEIQILRGPSSGGPFHVIDTVPITQTTYVDSTVTVRQGPYCYESIAIGPGGESEPSEVLCATVTNAN